MALKRNAIANYVGLIYTTLIGIVILPFYLQYLGAEAYGLIAFFTLLQSWLALLTMGMSPTLARQVAYARGQGNIGGCEFRQMLRSIELVIIVIGVVTGILIWAASAWIAERWLTIKDLALDETAYCIKLMGIMIGIRWIVLLYQSGLRGMERQIWLNGFNVIFATLRYAAAYGLIRWVTQEPAHFFEFQLNVSIIELTVITLKFYRCLPKNTPLYDPGLAFSWQAMRGIVPFAAGLGYTSMLWVFMTQTDKLILSHVLTLAEYGYLAIVALIANGILQLAEPINQAILPRMTILFSEGREAQMLSLYRKTSQYMTVLVISLAGILALFSERLIFAITGNETASHWGGPVLTWFAFGNGILVIVGMQYVLQYVHGKVKMHVINTTINALVQVPILAYVALECGAIEVAMTWFAIRTVTFFVWPAIVHGKFAPGLHLNWLRHDIFPPFAAIAVTLSAVCWGISWNPQILTGRGQILSVLVAIGFIVLFSGTMAASEVRGDLKNLFNRLQRDAH